jgi:hypothetical protein
VTDVGYTLDGCSPFDLTSCPGGMFDDQWIRLLARVQSSGRSKCVPTNKHLRCQDTEPAASMTISSGLLSSRHPRNVVCRNCSSSVHSANATSQVRVLTNPLWSGVGTILAKGTLIPTSRNCQPYQAVSENAPAMMSAVSAKKGKSPNMQSPFQEE